jgi:hypothetical protein
MADLVSEAMATTAVAVAGQTVRRCRTRRGARRALRRSLSWRSTRGSVFSRQRHDLDWYRMVVSRGNDRDGLVSASSASPLGRAIESQLVGMTAINIPALTLAAAAPADCRHRRVWRINRWHQSRRSTEGGLEVNLAPPRSFHICRHSTSSTCRTRGGHVRRSFSSSRQHDSAQAWRGCGCAAHREAEIADWPGFASTVSHSERPVVAAGTLRPSAIRPSRLARGVMSGFAQDVRFGPRLLRAPGFARSRHTRSLRHRRDDDRVFAGPTASSCGRCPSTARSRRPARDSFGSSSACQPTSSFERGRSFSNLAAWAMPRI